MTQLLLQAHVSKLTISANVETTKEEIKELKKERSEALKSLQARYMSETATNTVSGTLNRIDLEMAAKKGELAELVRSQEAAESKLKELYEGFRFQVKSGPKL